MLFSSPDKQRASPSALTQRLKEAEALDTHLTQLEHARRELQQQQQQQNRLGPPPPPPPRPPTTQEDETEEEDASLPPLSSSSSPTSSQQTLQRVLDLAPRYFSDATALNSIRELIAQAAAAGGQEDDDRHNNALVMLSSSSHQLHLQQPHHKDQGGGGVGGARCWEAVITSATIRHGRVEYEIRSQLTSGNTTGTSVVRRRYRDFDRLRRALLSSSASSSSSQRGVLVIPRLPPKDAHKLHKRRTDPDFVWNRRIALQFWLRFVFDHQLVRNSSLVREFLWEPTSCAVSNEKKRFEDHNAGSEAKLWHLAVQQQHQCMEHRFGNPVVALTSMQLRIQSQIHSLSLAGERCQAVIKRDEEMSRLRARAHVAYKDFAALEIGSGQNFTFLQKFAACLPAKDVNRPVAEDSFLVSFKTNEHYVEAPVALGAGCDVRSVKAVSTLLHMWGLDVLPALQQKFVSPEKACPGGGGGGGGSEQERDMAQRVACEWVEMESLKLNMTRDCLGRFVLDQMKHAREEQARWRGVVDSIHDQEVEMSSFFVGLGTSSRSSSSNVKSGSASGAAAGGGVGGGDSGASTPLPSTARVHHSARSTATTTTDDSSDNESEEGSRGYAARRATAAATASASSSPAQQQHHHHHHQFQLDSNLDDAQARFVQQDASLLMMAADDEHSVLSFDGRNGFLNPFDDAEE